MPESRPHIALRLLLAVLPVTLLLGLGELAARTLWEPPIQVLGRQASEGTSMSPHPTRLWAPPTGDLDQFGVVTPINEDNLRAVPVTGAPLRALTLGDSSIFGHALEHEDTLHASLQASLAKRGVQVDVHCGGVPGYSVLQSTVLMEEVGWDLEPDLLVVGNMWSDTNMDRFVDKELFEQLGSPSARLDFALRGSMLWTWMRRLGSTSTSSGATAAHTVTWLDSRTTSGRRRVPLADYARLLDALVREAGRRGVSVAVLAPASRQRMTSPDSTQLYAPYLDTLRGLAAHHGLPMVDGAHTLRAAREVQDDLFVDTLHPSGRANELYGEALADALVSHGWPERSISHSPDAAPSPPTDDWESRLHPSYGKELVEFNAMVRVLTDARDVSADREDACAQVMDELPLRDCVLARVSRMDSPDSSTVEPYCARLPLQWTRACEFEAALASGDPRRCARSMHLKARCWRDGFLLTERDDWVPTHLPMAQAIDEVRDLLTTLDEPPNDPGTWRRTFEVMLPADQPPELSACEGITSAPLQAHCRQAMVTRMNRWCADGEWAGQDFLEALGLPEILSRTGTTPGGFEGELQATLERLGMPPRHSCTWTTAYVAVLALEQPVLSSRCKGAPDQELQALCLSAADRSYRGLLNNALRAGELSCDGPAPGRIGRLADPRLLELLAKWRSEGRCGDARPSLKSPKTP